MQDYQAPDLPEIDLQAKSLIDLQKYDASAFERGKPNWVVLLWWLIQAIAFPLSLHHLNGFRCWLLRLFGAQIGHGVVIRPTARFTYPWKVAIGDYCWVGDDVVFYSIDQIQIGSHSVISQKSYLCTAGHDFNKETFPLLPAPIKIGNGVWIATDCFIAPGVTIGSNAVIGARSSVFRNIANQQVAWGSPCKTHYSKSMSKDS